MRRSVVLPVILLALGALLALRGFGSDGSSAAPKAAVTPPPTASPALDDTAQEPTAAPPTVTAATLPTESPTATPQPTKAPSVAAQQATATKQPEPTSTPRPRKTSTPKPRPTSTPTPKPTSTPVPLLTMYVISPEGANLRGKPTTESEVRAVLPYASRVQARADTVRGVDSARWYKVSQGSKDGYIRGSLLGRTKPAPLPTPTPLPTATPVPTSPPVTPTPVAVNTPVAANPPAAPVAAVGMPVRLVIDTGAVYVNTAIEYVGKTPEGAMDVPQRWDNVGWYRLGTVPGREGNAVIAGHLDTTTGPAVFWDLEHLRPGDIVTVIDDRNQAIRFRVRSLQEYYVDDAPLQQIFGNTSGAHLNLITCSGYFDRGAGGYDQRLVVYTDLIQ